MNLPKNPKQWTKFRALLGQRDKNAKAAKEKAATCYADSVGPMARGFCYRAGLSAADAEDLAVSAVTDTFLKLDQFDGENFPAWFFTILRHMISDKFRRRVDCVPLLDGDFPHADGKWGANGSLPDKVHDAIEDALKSLKPEDRHLVEVLEGREKTSQSKLAKELKIKEGTLRVRLLRVKRKLRKILAADERMNANTATTKQKTNKP